MHYTELFNNKSELYAQARPSYPEALYSFLAKQCLGRECAWDCACGNGQSSKHLVQYFSRVKATDISPNQIANALKHPQIAYTVCPSEQTPFKSDMFDIVCVAQALHWMQFDAFWPEVKRVLKPSGLFAAWGYSWIRLNPEIDALIQAYLLDIIEPYWAEQNKLLWDHYKDISIPFTSIDTPVFTMQANWTLEQLMAYLYTWSSTRRCIELKSDKFFDELCDQLLKVWGEVSRSKTVEFDFCCFVGRYEI